MLWEEKLGKRSLLKGQTGGEGLTAHSSKRGRGGRRFQSHLLEKLPAWFSVLKGQDRLARTRGGFKAT